MISARLSPSIKTLSGDKNDFKENKNVFILKCKTNLDDDAVAPSSDTVQLLEE